MLGISPGAPPPKPHYAESHAGLPEMRQMKALPSACHRLVSLFLSKRTRKCWWPLFCAQSAASATHVATRVLSTEEQTPTEKQRRHDRFGSATNK